MAVQHFRHRYKGVLQIHFTKSDYMQVKEWHEIKLFFINDFIFWFFAFVVLISARQQLSNTQQVIRQHTGTFGI